MTTARGRDTEPRRSSCAWCGAKLTGRQRRFCSPRHSARWWSGPEGRELKRKNAESFLPNQVKDRQCRYCKGKDHEIRFHPRLNNECEACSRIRHRAGLCQCGKLRLIESGEPVCYFCSPPIDKLRILLLEKHGTRERSIWRKVHAGKVRIGNHLFVINTLPMTVSVSTHVFVRTRR